MHTSLLLATRNRLAELQSCLAAIRRLRVPGGSSLEVLVVDNGSTDGTGSWLSSQPADQAPGIRLVPLSEPLPGKSRALNQAMRASTGEVLAFIDDDVEVDPDWLVGLEQGFATGAGALQGGIRLRLGGPRPWWMTPRVEAILAGTALWTPATPVTSMIGSNMAVRRADGVPLWCEGIGPGVPRFPFGEDTEWSARCLETRRGLFWPAMGATHAPEGRVHIGEILRRQVYGGLNQAIHSSRRPRLYRETLLALPREVARLAWHLLCGRPAMAMDAVWTLARHAGVLSAAGGRGQGHPHWSPRATPPSD